MKKMVEKIEAIIKRNNDSSERYSKELRMRCSERDRFLDNDFKQAKIAGYASLIGAIVGLGIAFGPKIYEPIARYLTQ